MSEIEYRSKLEALTTQRENARDSGRAWTMARTARSMMLARAYGGGDHAAAALDYPDAERLLKTSATSLSEMPGYAAVSTAWTGSLRNSAAEYLFRRARQVPRRTVTETVSGIIGSGETEGQAFTVRKMALGAGELTEYKVGALVVMTKDTLEAQDFNITFLDEELRAAIIASQDAQLITHLTESVTPISSSGSFKSDMRALFSAVPRGAGSKPFLIGGTTVRDEVSLTEMQGRRPGRLPITDGGGNALDLPFMTSDALAAGDMLLIDASQIVYWADVIELDYARHASLELSDSPTQSNTSPPGVTATTMINLFQSDSVGVMARRRFAIKRLTTNAVAHLTGIGAGSPALYWS